MIYAIDENKVHRRVNIAEAERLHDAGHKIVQADADGWIKWRVCSGQPISNGTRLDVKCQNGEVFFDQMHAAWCADGALRITHYRPIINQPASEESRGWDGDGLPPVGAVCEVNHFGEWHKTLIVGEDDGLPVFKTGWYDRYAYACGADFEFRPILTPREQWVEKAADRYCDNYAGADMRVTIGLLYDALASGELPTPEKTE